MTLARPRHPSRRSLWIAGLYLALLATSDIVRWRSPEPPVDPGRRSALLPEVTDEAPRAKQVRMPTTVKMVWSEWEPPAGASEADHRLPVLLVHGSPGDGQNFAAVGAALGESRPALAPDLPGFGESTLDIPDYSIRAHAGYLLELLDHLRIERVHLVGYSMGGGVVLELAELAPHRIASVTLLSATGVQELELLGSYGLNHLVHGLQLAALWLLQEGTPHFGVLDRFPLNVAYARNFYDTDQRPLREVLERLTVPVLIVHGENDPLVPLAAALEHHRIVPQSELEVLPASHFFVFRDRFDLSRRLESFFEEVENGAAPHRRDALPERIAASRRPFDPRSLPSWTGPAVLAVMLLLALATLVSEDLTCIGAGVLVAQGRLAFFPAALACFLGILAGDLALFWVGRLLGRPVVRQPPLRWWITEQALRDSSAWLERRGGWVILASRFLPGTRLPTYLAAGVLRTSFLAFTLYFFVAAALWTPALVAISARLGHEALGRLEDVRHGALVTVLTLAALMLFARTVAVPIMTHRGRRRWLGRLRRLWSWEFWPTWLFYPPVIAYILWLGIRHRSLTLFTTVNPAMPAGGFIGESKSDILRRLEGGGVGPSLPKWRLLSRSPAESDPVATLRDCLEHEGLGYPIVLKPDVGQRGAGVAVVRNEEEALAYLERHRGPTLVQEYVPGEEFGVFYYRYPEDDRGHVFAINEKRFPRLRGDGKRSLEELVFDDPRAVVIASTYLRELGERRRYVPAPEEDVQLVEIGAHARGAIFLDVTDLLTPALERTMDALARKFEGFDFGRFDVRVPSRAALLEGRQFRIIEVNGVTSEATNLYDPRHSLREAWGILFRQWRIAFEIGDQRRREGFTPVSAHRLLALLWSYRRRQQRAGRRSAPPPSASPTAS